MSIDLNSVLKCTSEVVKAEVDGEMVMMSIESGAYYGMNGVGKVIWDKLSKPTSVAEICSSLQNEFAVDKDICEKEVITFLTTLKNDNLIELN